MTLEARFRVGENFDFPSLAALAEGIWARGMEPWGRLLRRNVDAGQMILEANVKALAFLTAAPARPGRTDVSDYACPRREGMFANESMPEIDLPEEAAMTHHGDIDETHFQKVSERAYAKWLDEGQAHGRDQEHWRDAEAEIIAEEEQEAAKAVTPSRSAPETPKPPKSGSSKRAA